MVGVGSASWRGRSVARPVDPVLGEAGVEQPVERRFGLREPGIDQERVDQLSRVLEGGRVVAGLEGDSDVAALRASAAARAQATIPMEAQRGRASFLKERSIGHMDPGARSSQLMIEAVCDVLEPTP